MVIRNDSLKRCLGFGSLAVFVGISFTPTQAIMIPINDGAWPEDWPAELEPFRDRARSVSLATSIDGNDYLIPFESREEFEALWPVLLRLKSKGAPIHIRNTDPLNEHYRFPKWDHTRPMVRIFAPSQNATFGNPPYTDEAGNSISTERVKLWHKRRKGQALTLKQRSILRADEIVGWPNRLDLEAMKENNGEWVKTGPPWPEDIRNEKGELPEYVWYEKMNGRLRWTQEDERAFVRCRIELELVVDGRIIDLDRLEFPEDTPIIDEREQ